ncbi:hypothetical protein TNCV_3285341 [Trichonephila clavipes]|nr:hypothetical protein TNCV_3285341 [Trichonephila clavipes]
MLLRGYYLERRFISKSRLYYWKLINLLSKSLGRTCRCPESPFVAVVWRRCQMAEIANGVYGADTVTANYVQFWIRRFRSGNFYVKDAPHTGRTVVENVDKIT